MIPPPPPSPPGKPAGKPTPRSGSTAGQTGRPSTGPGRARVPPPPPKGPPPQDKSSLHRPPPPPGPAPSQKKQRSARDVSEYTLLGPIGEGAYGKVWKAQAPDKRSVVALKMIKTGGTGEEEDDQGFPITSVREIRILNRLRHPNIVNLKEVVTDLEGKVEGGKAGGAYMVFEYLEADLEGILRTPEVRLSPLHIKSYVKQMLSGMEYMHKQKIIHRDLKGASGKIFPNTHPSLRVTYYQREKGEYEWAE
ncbi:unnamed protein product [Chrysoparadoxa australica]